MTEIIINDDYRLKKADKYNWLIEKQQKVKTGKNKGNLIWKNCGYFPRVDQAARFLLDRIINEKEFKTLSDINRNIIRARKQISDAVLKAKIE